MRQTKWLAATAIIVAGMAGLVRPQGVLGASPQASSGWSLAYDHPYPGKYEDFAFPNAKSGWLVNAGGEIHHTMDGGLTWTQQASAKGPLRSIDFIDDKRGFAGTLAGVLWGSTDGGATWTDITAQLPRATKGFCGMTHVGEHVHIVGRYNGNVADYYYSPDGGKTWRDSSLIDVMQGLVDVSFINDNVGFIGGMAVDPQVPLGTGPARILKTTDGGKTWRPVFTDTHGRGFAWKIFPMSAKLIYTSLQSQDGTLRIVKSVDGGETWDTLNVATGKPMTPGIQGIGFIDEKTGWVGGFFTGMYGTTDGGNTWEALPVTDRTINRFEKVAGVMITASTRGVLRYDPKAPR